MIGYHKFYPLNPGTQLRELNCAINLMLFTMIIKFLYAYMRTLMHLQTGVYSVLYKLAGEFREWYVIRELKAKLDIDYFFENIDADIDKNMKNLLI